MTSRVSFHDLYPSFGISVNSKGTIQDIHKYAHMYGGVITIYDMRSDWSGFDDKPYRLSYRLNKPPFEFLIYGIDLTEDEYETQKPAWNGAESIIVERNAQITLIDNSYLLIR
jgi:hypothetical protein